MKKLLYLAFFLILAVFALTINLKNPQSVELNYYFGLYWSGPIVLILTATFLLGLLFGWLFMSLSVFKNKRVVGKTRRQLAKVEKEVENLRTMPIKNDA
jgi:putative membrane protein